MPISAAQNRFQLTERVVSSLAEQTAAARARLKITPTVQAKQIGISKTTLVGIEAGKTPSYATIIATLRWLGTH